MAQQPILQKPSKIRINIADSYNYRAMAKAMKGDGNGAMRRL